MKKMILTLMAMLTIAASANAMSYEQARNEALFLTDKMAYELNLSDAQYEACYEINLDYLMGVTSQYDVFGPYWERRNLDLSYILFSWQWELFRAATYFYRPLYFDAGYWHFGIYARYPHRDYFFFGRPAFYVSYRGGHSWRMNGGHSYYEGRRDHYRPDNRSRDQHFGMRNGWDRGDYRNGGPGGRPSSTHVTGGNGFNDRPNDGTRMGGGRSGGQQGGFGSGRFGGNVNDRPNNPNGGGQPQGGRPDNRPEGNLGTGSPSGNGGIGGTRGNIGSGNNNGGGLGTSRSNGSFGGNRPSSGNTTIGTSRPNVGNNLDNSRPSTLTPSRPSTSGGNTTIGTTRPVTTPRPSTGNTSVGTSRPSTGGSSVGTSRPSSGGSSIGSSRSSGGGSTRSGGSVGGGGRSGGSNSHGSFGGRR